MEELKGMDYDETRLIALEARRIMADMEELFKIMKGMEGLKREDSFEMEGRRT